MLAIQQSLSLSPFMELYDILIPQDHFLRQVKQLVDFSFVENELLEKYCLDNGRNAVPPIRMFKYLFLKLTYNLSDRDVVERAKFDLSFKYFLDTAPEDDVIHPSLLTKFRRERLKDINLLDMLLNKTVEIALEKGVLQSNSLIVDATHTVSKYNKQSPCQILRERAKQLRKAVYAIEEGIKEKLPSKNRTEDFEKEMAYCRELLAIIKQEESLKPHAGLREKMNLLEETMEDTIAYIQCSSDQEARTGHKTPESSFFGYKTHIAMSDERLITAAVITSGEKADGPYLQELLEKTKENGLEIKEVIGDSAYSSKENIEYCQGEKIELISKLSSRVTHQNNRNCDRFSYNKDAGMYVCQGGHMAIKKAASRNKNAKENPRMRYFFDIEKCRRCPYKEGCYKEGNKSKVFSVSILSDEHTHQAAYEQTQEFKEKYKTRYKIEAKNGEIKNQHGYDRTQSDGIRGFEIQGAATLFCVNVKRILKLMKEKENKKA